MALAQTLISDSRNYLAYDSGSESESESENELAQDSDSDSEDALAQDSDSDSEQEGLAQKDLTMPTVGSYPESFPFPNPKHNWGDTDDFQDKVSELAQQKFTMYDDDGLARARMNFALRRIKEMKE